jgi:hypothetical protein
MRPQHAAGGGTLSALVMIEWQQGHGSTSDQVIGGVERQA